MTEPSAAFAAGQIWEYRTRPNEPNSLLRIHSVEADPRGAPIFHISVIGVGLPYGEISHLPVSQNTLDASAIRLSSAEASFPDAEEGIAIWRENRGGVFTVTVAEALDYVEQVIAQGQAKQL